MSQYGIRLCSFTSLDELRPRERSDPMAVLEVLRRTRRFSAFDMYDMKLVGSVETLKRSGLIRTDSTKHSFPWIAVEIIEPAKKRPALAIQASPNGEKNG